MNRKSQMILIVGMVFAASCVSMVESEQSTRFENVQLVEKVTSESGEITIPFEKYILSNGLTVILHQDYSDPLVHVDVTYHVGSAREEIGRSGFAHFFEHMMFQGSANVGDEEHARIVTEAGGTFNGSTDTDRTNYYQTVPKNHLEMVLWLEGDRMGFLLPAVTQESFEVQRATIKNERAQNFENRPYGLVMENKGRALYPEGHPYSWQPIGFVEDLDRVDVNDLKSFFSKWYGPNNATLSIGGDFERQQVLEWVQKYFGSIPRGTNIPKLEKPRFALEADRYTSMEDQIATPMLFRSFPTVHARHEDEAALDILASIIGGDESSMLHDGLMKKSLALSANSQHNCSELACTFSIMATPNLSNNVTLTEIDQITREILSEFEGQGVEEEDLTRIKSAIRSNFVLGLASVSSRITQLAYWETFFDRPNLIQEEIARYEKVTADDVKRVYHQYIQDKPSVIMSIVPRGQMEAIAAPDTWTPKPRDLSSDLGDSEYDPMARETVDKFDRAKPPHADQTPIIQAPVLWKGQLTNGVKVVGSTNSEAPITTIMLRFRAGHRDDPLDRLGVSAMTASMLNESTARSSKKELSEKLQKLGTRISFGSGLETSGFVLTSLSENLNQSIEIANEMLLHPGFRDEDFQRVKDKTLAGIRSSRKNSAAVAESVRSLLLYGTNNAFAWPLTGTEKSVSKITIDDVREFYQTRYSPQNAEIIIVSDLSEQELTPSLSVLETWKRELAERPAIQPFPLLNSGAIYLVDKPGAVQTEIRIAKRAQPFDATGSFYRATVVSFPLGIGLNSRINLSLREDKGYTYGAEIKFGATDYAGSLTGAASVNSKNSAQTITEFFRVMNEFASSGMTTEELAFTKSSLSQREALAYESSSNKAALIAEILLHDLEPDFRAAQAAILRGMTTEETRSIASAHMNTDDMIVIVVGDKAKIENDLRALNMPIVEVDEIARHVSGSKDH